MSILDSNIIPELTNIDDKYKADVYGTWFDVEELSQEYGTDLLNNLKLSIGKVIVPFETKHIRRVVAKIIDLKKYRLSRRTPYKWENYAFEYVITLRNGQRPIPILTIKLAEISS